MEIRFIVNSRRDLASACTFARVNASGKRWIRYLLAILWLVLAAWYWYLFRITAFSLVIALFGAYRLYRAICWDKIIGKRMMKNANPRVEAFHYTFTDEAVQVSNAVEDSLLQYGAFIRAVESDDYFFLYVGKSMAHCLSKTGFEQGNTAEFGAFIAEKTGLEVKRVKG